MESRTYFPITPSQRSMYLARQFSFHKQVMNVPTSVFVDHLLDMALLRQAVEDAIQRWDAFGVRLTRQDKEVRQYFTDRRVLSLEIIDFSQKSPAAMEAFFVKMSAKPMKLYDSPLARIYLVKAPDGGSGIYSCISHLIMDSWAISMFYKDILEIYFARRNNAAMPKPVRSYESCLQKEIAYAASDRHTQDHEFWRQETEEQSEPIYTSVNGSVMLEKVRKRKKNPNFRAGNGFFLRTTASHYVQLIDKPLVDAMKDFCVANKFPTMQVLFLMAVRTYLAKMNNRERDVTFYNVVARRGTLEEKQSGGTRVHFLFYRTIMDEDITCLEACNQMLAKQNTIYRHADISPFEFLEMIKKRWHLSSSEGYSGLSVTFQPVPMVVEGMKVTTRWHSTGAASNSLYLTVMDGDGTGALRCYYEYLDKVIAEATVVNMHRYIVRIIQAGVADPTIKLKDLLDLPL